MNHRGRVSAVVLAMVLTQACACVLGCGGGGSEKSSAAAEKIVPGVTKENVHKIKVGMSEQEVAEILGKYDRENSPLSGKRSQIWSRDGIEVVVFFDASGKVALEPIHNFED
jgi:hypothetical protein